MTGSSEVEDFIEKLNKTELPILVEGSNDKNALIKAGVKNKIYTLSRKPLYLIAEQLSNIKEIIFLFDNDKAGRELSHKMSVELSRYGVKINKKFQIMFKKLHYTHVEGLR